MPPGALTALPDELLLAARFLLAWEYRWPPASGAGAAPMPASTTSRGSPDSVPQDEAPRIPSVGW